MFTIWCENGWSHAESEVYHVNGEYWHEGKLFICRGSSDHGKVVLCRMDNTVPVAMCREWYYRDFQFRSGSLRMSVWSGASDCSYLSRRGRR